MFVVHKTLLYKRNLKKIMQCPTIKSFFFPFGFGFFFPQMHKIFCHYCWKKWKTHTFLMNFQPKIINFYMALHLIYLYQYHWPKKISPKKSTCNPNFEVCMQFFIFHDEYYFVTNILHMLKFINVCWSF
jgi:hypothetical protein